MSFFNKIFGDPNAKEISKVDPIVKQINELEAETEKLSDEDLKGKTQEFRDRLKQGESLDDLLPEAFAVVRETSKRVLGMRHYDVQLIGGIILHRGQITEMRTGEGKTLVATLPLYLNALAGKGVHLVTVNDYLARRDATWMGQIYHALGMSLAVIQQLGVSYIYDPKDLDSSSEDDSHANIEMKDLQEVERKAAYECDILYGTNNEYGFDYLRDNMSQTLEGQAQRKLYFAIVDEVDSILIDEARTPLIISAPAAESATMYQQFARIIPSLKEGEDYNIDEKMKASTLTEEGLHKVEKTLGIENLYTEGGIKQVHHLEQALKAQTLFQKDKEYVVRDGEVVIVDEFTGRMMEGRRYSDGLHQAIEAKEGVPVQQESRTMATITFQNYFRLYEKLAGMTGTAKTEEEEFAKIYGLSVLVIPTNKPIVRKDMGDRIYKNGAGKYEALIREIKEKQALGQPVLVGTVSIENNEKLSNLLRRSGIKFEVLNAKDHEREAQVIAQAGRPGSVTVATNMAGRGVDILLGGDPFDEASAKKVKELGGLHVIGTERHESRRIDNQLRGRAGRQGDPGSSVFFISTEDDLMRVFGSDRMRNVMERLGVPDDMPIENKIISKSIESAQKKVEGHNFDIRKHLVEYDDVINKHRESIYTMRQNILESYSQDVVNDDSQTPTSPSPLLGKEGSELRNQIVDMIEEEIEEVVNFHTQAEGKDGWNLDEIIEVAGTIMPLSTQVKDELKGLGKNREGLISKLVALSEETYDKWENNIINNPQAQGDSFVRNIEKAILLRSIDTLWVEHIDALDHLRTGIGLRGYGQRDPLVEYKKDSFRMFVQLKGNIRKQVVYSIFKVGGQLQQTQNQDLSLSGADKTMSEGHGQFSSITTTALPTQGQSGGDVGQAPRPAERLAKKKEGVQDAPVTSDEKIGRNDPCPCGAINSETNKSYKYKKCGMINASHHKG